MTEFQSVDDFLNYRGNEGGGGKRLKSWQKDPGYLNFWFHTKQYPCAVWYHRLPELVIRTDKDDPNRTLKNVWGRQHACYEDDKILKKQHFRTGDGSREHPPKRCGICRCIECIRRMIVEGSLKDTDLLFRWDGSDKPEEDKSLHAGGFCSIWKRNPDEDVKQRLAKHGIYFGNAPGRMGVWSESAVASLSYVFVGVNHDDVQSGVQVAVQSKGIGEKVQAAINREIASNDGNLGNPFLNPYCIQIVYRPEEREFGKKYDAFRVNKHKMTPEIERLITGERPNISRYTKKFDQALIRSQLEKHCLRELPWDSIFDVPGDAPDAAPPVEPPRPKTTAQVPENVGVQVEEQGDPCDDCGSAMTKTQTKCGKCGAVYAVEEEPAAKPATKSATPSPPPDPDAVYDVEDNDVPF